MPYDLDQFVADCRAILRRDPGPVNSRPNGPGDHALNLGGSDGSGPLTRVRAHEPCRRIDSEGHR